MERGAVRHCHFAAHGDGVFLRREGLDERAEQGVHQQISDDARGAVHVRERAARQPHARAARRLAARADGSVSLLRRGVCALVPRGEAFEAPEAAVRRVSCDVQHFERDVHRLSDVYRAFRRRMHPLRHALLLCEHLLHADAGNVAHPPLRRKGRRAQAPSARISRLADGARAVHRRHAGAAGRPAPRVPRLVYPLHGQRRLAHRAAARGLYHLRAGAFKAAA